MRDGIDVANNMKYDEATAITQFKDIIENAFTLISTHIWHHRHWLCHDIYYFHMACMRIKSGQFDWITVNLLIR